VADNPLGIIDQLSALEREQYDALDKTPPPEDLLKEFRKPASVGWVKRYVDTHGRHCPAVLLLRKYAIAALVVSILSLGLNVAKSMGDDAVIRQTIRKAIAAQMQGTCPGVARVGSEP
jgi:hypothetical protein